MGMFHIISNGMKHKVRNVLPLHTSLTEEWGQYVIFFFSESSHVTYHISAMQVNILPLYTPTTPGLGQKRQTFFSEEGHVAYQIKRKEV